MSELNLSIDGNNKPESTVDSGRLEEAADAIMDRHCLDLIEAGLESPDVVAKINTIVKEAIAAGYTMCVQDSGTADK